MKKTCFVISPIGEKESEVRKLADDLFDLIVEPALEKFDFEIIRADKIASSSSITTDIIHHVQNSDLCIIDLTGRNPNVMYECGRRHETGKPFVMVALEGEELPFDINSIRTFFYNISDSRAMRETVKTIQSVVSNLIEEGFGPKSSGESLSTISDSLRRIENKLLNLTSNQNPVELNPDQTSSKPDILKMLSPEEAYAYAFKVRDYRLAGEILPFILEKTRDAHTSVFYSIPMADESEIAARVVEQHILDFDPANTELNLKAGYTNLVTYYITSGLSEAKKDFVIQLYEKLSGHAKDNEEKASLLNQLQKIHYASGDYEGSTKLGEEVLKLWRDTHYLYNQSLNYEKVGDMENSLKMVDEFIELGTEDADHLERAIRMYKKHGREEEADKLLKKLTEINRFKADIIS